MQLSSNCCCLFLTSGGFVGRRVGTWDVKGAYRDEYKNKQHAFSVFCVLLPTLSSSPMKLVGLKRWQGTEAPEHGDNTDEEGALQMASHHGGQNKT